MYHPPMTKSLAVRVEFGEIHYLLAWVKALRSINNNEYGAEVRQWGSAVAVQVRSLPGSPYNRVLGAGDETVEVLDEIIAWFRASDRPVRFDLIPANGTEKLMAALAKRGLYQTGFSAAMYTAPAFDNGVMIPLEIQVEPIPPGDKDLMTEVYAAAYGLTSKNRLPLTESLWVLFDHPAARFYGAHINDKLVAVAALFISDSIGYLTGAATLSPMRNRGCHAALLRQRLTTAALEQCDLVVASVDFASQSQRNLERASLRMAYTKAIWTDPPQA